MVFWGEKNFLSANLMGKKILSLTWAETNIMFALWALKNIVFVEKNNVATTCLEKKIPLSFEANKKTTAPPPLS